jgi:ribosomal protein S18 acetylase RimI-like enzyme
MLREDLAAIDAIGAELHPLLSERPEVFAEKLRLFPQGSMALVDAAGIAGYGLCHPWRLNDIPPLDSFLVALPRDADCMFIHDVAVLPRARGRRAADAYVEHVCKLARERGLGSLALASVNRTGPLWESFGFMIGGQASLAEKLKSYGDGAIYMVRKLL